MKRLILILFIPLALLAGPGQFRQSIPLVWTYPTNEVSPDLIFKLYSSPNLATPTTNWPVVATYTNTARSCTVSNLGLGQRFFFLTASNWWGESLPSNVADTGPVPSDQGKISIGQ